MESTPLARNAYGSKHLKMPWAQQMEVLQPQPGTPRDFPLHCPLLTAHRGLQQCSSCAICTCRNFHGSPMKQHTVLTTKTFPSAPPTAKGNVMNICILLVNEGFWNTNFHMLWCSWLALLTEQMAAPWHTALASALECKAQRQQHPWVTQPTARGLGHRLTAAEEQGHVCFVSLSNHLYHYYWN